LLPPQLVSTAADGQPAIACSILGAAMLTKMTELVH